MAFAQSFDLRRAPRLRELQQAKQVDQVVGEAMQEQPEGIGQKAVAAEPISAKAILELLDAVLALATIVVKRKDLGSAAGTVGDEEAEIGSRGGLLSLVQIRRRCDQLRARWRKLEKLRCGIWVRR